MKNIKLSPITVGLFQALGLFLYCGLIGAFIFTKAENWFGEMNQALGTTLFLLLFVVSALICGVIVFGYPVSLYLRNNKNTDSIKIVGYTALWLVAIVITIMVILALV